MGTTDGNIGEAFRDFTCSYSATLPITKSPTNCVMGVFMGLAQPFVGCEGRLEA
jgi:hypothetical protein